MEGPIKPVRYNSKTGRNASSSKSLYHLQKKKKSQKQSESSSESEYEGFTGVLSKRGKPDKRTKEYKKWKKDKKTKKAKKKAETNLQERVNSMGFRQSYDEGVRQIETPELTVMDRIRLSPKYVEGTSNDRVTAYQEQQKREEVERLLGKGPDPQGVDFLPMDNWGGIVDGYVYKTDDKGTGYYRTVSPNEGKYYEKSLLNYQTPWSRNSTPYMDLPKSEAANYRLKKPVKPQQEDNVYRGRKYYQQQKENELKKLKELQESAKKAIKEREEPKVQEFDWVEYYNKQTPGHPLYEGDKKQEAQDFRMNQSEIEGLLRYDICELRSYDNEKLKQMVIDDGIPIEDIVAMDFNKDIKEQLIELLNRKGL